MAVHQLSQTPGLVALGAATVALGALILCIVLFLKLKRIQAAQRVVLGEHRNTDIIAHAADLQTAFEQLHARVEETAERVEDRLLAVQTRLDGALSGHALIRYDAYGEMSGHQSATLALLDTNSNGVVLSSIAHRSSSQLYLKQVVNGQGKHELSPEESEAIEQARPRIPEGRTAVRR